MNDWFSEQERDLLTARWREHPDDGETLPVARLFQPDGSGVWLVSEIDPEDSDLAYGLCDHGLGAPELGEFSLAELDGLRGRLGLPVERDASYRPRLDLDELAHLAVIAGRIVG